MPDGVSVIAGYFPCTVSKSNSVNLGERAKPSTIWSGGESLARKDRVSLEGQLLDQKSLRAVTGKTAAWNEITKDCIAFANATGGCLLLGLEEGQDAPPAGQKIPDDLPDTVRRKLSERTVNGPVLPDVLTAPNGGQYIELRIPRANALASTTDGRCFLRVADQS